MTGDNGLGLEVDRNKEANDIIIKVNRREDRGQDNKVSPNPIPGSKLDTNFLSLFAQ